MLTGHGDPRHAAPELAPAQAALGVSTHVVYGAPFPDPAARKPECPAGPLSSSTPGALSVGTAGDPATGLLPALKDYREGCRRGLSGRW